VVWLEVILETVTVVDPAFTTFAGSVSVVPTTTSPKCRIPGLTVNCVPPAVPEKETGTASAMKPKRADLKAIWGKVIAL